MKPFVKKVLRFTGLIALFVTMAGVGAYLTLTLIIRGEKPVVVPDLVNKEVLYGLELLSDLGLNTRVRGTIYHDHVPKNHVIDQEPEAGASIKKGRDVKIRVSRGSERIVTPNLSGLSLQQGRILLNENGLCEGNLASIFSRQYAAGQVMAQFPLAGAVVSRENCLDLLVSRGPATRKFAAPMLSGALLANALGRLEKMQLTAGGIQTALQAGRLPETILSQRPPAGYRVSVGSRVALTVNRMPAVESADVRNLADRTKLFRFTVPNGFLNKRVEVTLNRPDEPLRLFDDFVPPGQEIWLLVPKNDTSSSILVHVDGQSAGNP
jgi:serine/threonine-protein kinase